jgi:hypothetical protein
MVVIMVRGVSSPTPSPEPSSFQGHRAINLGDFQPLIVMPILPTAVD